MKGSSAYLIYASTARGGCYEGPKCGRDSRRCLVQRQGCASRDPSDSCVWVEQREKAREERRAVVDE
mgnify:CR=1 FL=1